MGGKPSKGTPKDGRLKGNPGGMRSGAGSKSSGSKSSGGKKK